jgi:hypothetical protein
MQNLKPKTTWRVIDTTDWNEITTVFIPTTKKFANAKVLEVFEDCFTVHRIWNYNEYGDFRTELMIFNDAFTLNTNDLEYRNKIRKQIWLQEI